MEKYNRSQNAVYANSPLRYVVTSNAPLRNQKGTVYEGGIREPLIVHWPGKIKKGTVTDAIVSGVDFYPTLLEIAGAEKPENQVLDGKSMLPVLFRNEYDKDRAIFWHYPVYHHDVPAGAVRKGNWKLVENLVSRTVSLYDLETDISETTDLSKAFPEKTRELYLLLKEWQIEVKAEFPVPNPDFNAERRFEWGKHPDTK